MGTMIGRPIPPFVPLTMWPDYFPWPSVSALRALVFRQDTNGFAPCVRKVGKRVLIDTQAFLDWIAARSHEASS